jgi:FKBP-type peptidyl-prolyl cis-trans isomerase 2
MVVQKGKVISILFSLRLDKSNRLVASRLKKPLEFLVGKRKLILGLDEQLLGLKVGDKKQVKIEPENGFGLRNEARCLSLKRSQISENTDVHEGMILKSKTKKGKLVKGIIKSFDDKNVVVDLNHPLAGETLCFKTEIVQIRDATKDEIENRA